MNNHPPKATRGKFSRRILMTGAGMAAAGAAGTAVSSESGSESRHNAQAAAWIAKQEIAELRRLYARATDLIGMASEDSIAEGRAIYHCIFTPDAAIDASGAESSVGPDGWVDVVLKFLKDYEVTQHLIGTQLVDVDSLPDAKGNGGAASMLSYVQAWHSTADEVWLFLGTYKDKLSFSNEAGWQISEMFLEPTVIERRPFGTL